MTAPKLGKRLPPVPLAIIVIVLAVGACFAVGLGWRGVAANEVASKELPFLMSGGLAGLGLVGTGVGLFAIQSRRRAEAVWRAHFDLVVRTAARGLSEAAHTGQEE